MKIPGFYINAYWCFLRSPAGLLEVQVTTGFLNLYNCRWKREGDKVTFWPCHNREGLEVNNTEAAIDHQTNLKRGRTWRNNHSTRATANEIGLDGIFPTKKRARPPRYEWNQPVLHFKLEILKPRILKFTNIATFQIREQSNSPQENLQPWITHRLKKEESPRIFN